MKVKRNSILNMKKMRETYQQALSIERQSSREKFIKFPETISPSNLN